MIMMHLNLLLVMMKMNKLEYMYPLLFFLLLLIILLYFVSSLVQNDSYPKPCQN